MITICIILWIKNTEFANSIFLKWQTNLYYITLNKITLGLFASGEEYLRGVISRARGSMFTRYSCLQMHVREQRSACCGDKEPRYTFFDSALINLMHRDSNYLSLSRPQTQLVQRAQWAQYPVEEIAMRDRRIYRGRANRQYIPDKSRELIARVL